MNKNDTAQTPSIFDCHLHLQDPAFDADREEAIERAEAGGVFLLAVNGTSPADWPAVADIAGRHKCVLPCYGLHPWFAQDQEADWPAELEKFLDSGPAGVGEAGLDFSEDKAEEDFQTEIFRIQWCIANERGLPITVHCVHAWSRLMQILREDGAPAAGMLLHGYSGPAEMIKQMVSHGAYFSFGAGMLDEKRKNQRRAFMETPLERLLMESESPNMPPPRDMANNAADLPGGRMRNEPSNLPNIMRAAARMRGINERQFMLALLENGKRLFGKLLTGKI